MASFGIVPPSPSCLRASRGEGGARDGAAPSPFRPRRLVARRFPDAGTLRRRAEQKRVALLWAAMQPLPPCPSSAQRRCYGLRPEAATYRPLAARELRVGARFWHSPASC